MSPSTDFRSPEEAIEVSYDDVCYWLKTPEDITIIDVREPDEYASGHVPGAINVPFRSDPEALGLEASDFVRKYNVVKPLSDRPVLFYCQGGGRALAAERAALSYGYVKRYNYKGSFNDWIAQTARR